MLLQNKGAWDLAACKSKGGQLLFFFRTGAALAGEGAQRSASQQ